MILERWMAYFDHIILNTHHNLFSRSFLLEGSAKNMIPYLPSNPNHKILPTANDIFLAKIRMTEGAPPVSGKIQEGVAAHQGTKLEVPEGLGVMPSGIPGVGGGGGGKGG